MIDYDAIIERLQMAHALALMSDARISRRKWDICAAINTCILKIIDMSTAASLERDSS